MPSKLPRKRESGSSLPALSGGMDKNTAMALGLSLVVHGATQTAGEVSTAAVNATADVLKTSINTFGECFTSFMGYLKEREITQRVVAQETAATYRMEIWSRTEIAKAEERTEQVRISASLVLAEINDRASQRDTKLVVIEGFMSAYKDWNVMLTEALASRADRMPLHERELLQQHIDALLQRAREMETNITAIAVSL